MVVTQYLDLSNRWLFYPLSFQAVLKKGLSNDERFCFLKNLKEELQRSMKCLTTAPDGRVWGGPEMYRMVLKQQGPVCLLRVTDKKAQDLKGGTQSSAIICFW